MRAWMQTTVAAATLMGLIATVEHTRGAEPWTVVVSPDNSFSTLLAKDGRAILEAQIVTWGPNWAWVGSPSSQARAVDGVLKISGSMKISGETVTMACEAQQSGPQTVTYKYELTAEKDVPLTTLVNSLAVNSSISGKIVVTKVNEDPQTLPIPERRLAVSDVATELTFKLKDVGDVVLTLDPPCRIQAENRATRVELAHELLKAGKTVVTLTYRFPAPVIFVGSSEEQEKYTQVVAGPEWFTFQGSNDVAPSVIGFEPWLEKPAGKHGGVRMKGSQFAFEDGTPVRFWGTNLSYREGAPEKQNADDIFFRGQAVRHDVATAGKRLFGHRVAAGGGPAVWGLGVDSRVSVAIQCRRAGHSCDVRHGFAGLGCFVRIPVGLQPRGVVGLGGQLPLGGCGMRMRLRRSGSTPSWRGW